MTRAAILPLRPLLKAMLNPVARETLGKNMRSTRVQDLLACTWAVYPAHVAEVDNSVPLGIGPVLVLRLAVAAGALHDTLVEQGETHEGAFWIAAEVGWTIYRQMGRSPWLLSRVVSRTPGRRLLIATKGCRRFPFGPSAYVWKKQARARRRRSLRLSPLPRGGALCQKSGSAIFASVSSVSSIFLWRGIGQPCFSAAGASPEARWPAISDGMPCPPSSGPQMNALRRACLMRSSASYSARQ